MNNIIASFDKNFIIERLNNINPGLQAFSIFLINPITHRVIKEIKKVKNIEPKDFSQLNCFDRYNPYYIVNVQKIKLTDHHINDVFPVKLKSSFTYMWSSSDTFPNNFNFNTLKDDNTNNYLLYHNKNMFAFINDDNKFYYDNTMNFSTIKFDGCKNLVKGNIYDFSLRFKKIKVSGHM